MKRWRIGLVACLVVACLSMALTGCQTETYTPTSDRPAVSSAALGKDGTLRVGVNASSAPLAGQTSSSARIVGIDVDAAAYLADELGLKVEVIDVGNDPVSALEEGKVDIVMGVDASESESTYWHSNSYLQTGVALFSTASQTSIPTVDSGPKIGAQASSKSSWRVGNLFGDDSLVSESDLKTAFAALANGEVEYVAADAIIGSYVSHSNGYDNKIVALLQDPSGYCVAAAKDNAELQSALSTAVDTMVKGGMMGVIESKWLGSAEDLSSVTVIKSASDSAADGAQTESEDGQDSEDDGADAESGSDQA